MEDKTIPEVVQVRAAVLEALLDHYHAEHSERWATAKAVGLAVEHTDELRPEHYGIRRGSPRKEG